jgi:hypothetical protein
MTTLARAACALVHDSGVGLNASALFKSPLTDYDFLLHLHPRFAKKEGGQTAADEQAAAAATAIATTAAAAADGAVELSEEDVQLVGYKPVLLFIEELKVCFLLGKNIAFEILEPPRWFICRQGMYKFNPSLHFLSLFITWDTPRIYTLQICSSSTTLTVVPSSLASGIHGPWRRGRGRSIFRTRRNPSSPPLPDPAPRQTGMGTSQCRYLSPGRWEWRSRTVAAE